MVLEKTREPLQIRNLEQMAKQKILLEPIRDLKKNDNLNQSAIQRNCKKEK